MHARGSFQAFSLGLYGSAGRTYGMMAFSQLSLPASIRSRMSDPGITTPAGGNH